MRHQVLGHGWHFAPGASSNSTRKPGLFDWTNDPARATADVTVYMGVGIPDGVGAPGRKIAWILESPAISEMQGTIRFVNENLDAVMDSYEVVLTSDRDFCRLHRRILYHPPGSNLPWVPEEQYGLHPKHRLCGMFASGKTMIEGHHRRQRVAERLQGKLDLFGGACGSPRLGTGVHPDKSAGLLPYMFHVVMENARVPFYYTEKITDCFATGTVPIYWGSDCIGELFDTAGIIPFDGESFDLDQLSEDLYQEMLPAVRNNLARVRELESADDLLFRRYVDASPAPESRAADRFARETDRVPWPAWDPARVLAARSDSPMAPGARLGIVTSKRKQTIARSADVPEHLRSIHPVSSELEPARSAPREGHVCVPFPQLTGAVLLHLGDAFIGDGVVFDADRYYAMERWWLGKHWRHYENTKRIVHVEAAASVAAWGGEAFQHFVCDALPALASMIELLETPELSHVRIVSHDEPGTAAQWFWERLDLRDRVVAKPKNRRSEFVVHADRVLFAQFEPSAQQLGLYPRHTLRPIQGRLGTLDPGPRDRVVYLRRRVTRMLSDEDALLDRLRRRLEGTGLGLEVLEGIYSPGDAEELMRRARIVLGPHGGAFANMVFAQPGTHVVEFLPFFESLDAPLGNRPLMYYGLSQAAGHHYWAVTPLEYEHDQPHMRVSTDDVLAVVDRILSG